MLKHTARLDWMSLDDPLVSGYIDQEPDPMGDDDKPARPLPTGTVTVT